MDAGSVDAARAGLNATANVGGSQLVEIIAHRGASHDAPENTLAAFRLAWDQGADAAECDVHLSRDSQVVVIHDATTTRTTGYRRRVKDQTLAELRRLDAGSWKARRWRGERIPTLAEVLGTVPAGKRLFVEIKSGPQTVSPIQAAIRACGCDPTRVVIIGFDLQVMARAKRALPRIPVYWGLEQCESPRGAKSWAFTPREIIRFTTAAGLDGVDVDSRGPISKSFVNSLHSAGLGCFAWTVNNRSTARQRSAAGVDGITTDRPAWIRNGLTRR